MSSFWGSLYRVDNQKIEQVSAEIDNNLNEADSFLKELEKKDPENRDIKNAIKAIKNIQDYKQGGCSSVKW